MVERAVLLIIGGDMFFRAGFFTMGRIVFRVGVLPWIHGITWGSKIFLGEKWFLECVVLPWNHGRTRGSINF